MDRRITVMHLAHPGIHTSGWHMLMGIAKAEPMVLVPGVGPLITERSSIRGFDTQEPVFVDGRRILNPALLSDAVLLADINAMQYGLELSRFGIRTYITDSKSGVLTARLNLGYGPVGRDIKVKEAPLMNAVNNGEVPIVPSVGNLRGNLSEKLLLESDEVAATVAALLRKKGFDRTELVMITDVNGVKDSKGRLFPYLDRDLYKLLRNLNEIGGGMILKVEAALQAAEQGVRVLICHHENMITAFGHPSTFIGTEVVKQI